MPEVKKIKVKADLNNLERIIDFVISRARAAGLAEEKISDIHLAVDEACTNIIKYAYPEGSEGEIKVGCRFSRDSFIVSIQDWGKPFNPLESPSPDLNLDLEHRPIGGLGIFLMKKFSDKILYARENDSNRLQIVKNAAGGE